MTPADIDRVFGRGRLRMVTGDHVEVFREAVAAGRAAALHQALPGHRRRATSAQWTEREWRILARLVGHGIGPVPDVVQFDRGAADRPALVQTYDAGVTVDHWATLLPVQRDGDDPAPRVRGLRPLVGAGAPQPGRARRDPRPAPGAPRPQGRQRLHPGRAGRLRSRTRRGQLLQPRFEQHRADRLRVLARLRRTPRQRAADRPPGRLRLPVAAPAARRWRPAAAATSAPTRQLDWRCDLFSLAAMLRRYLPEPEQRRRRRLDAAAPRAGAGAGAPPARGPRRRAAGAAAACRADRR